MSREKKINSVIVVFNDGSTLTITPENASYNDQVRSVSLSNTQFTEMMTDLYMKRAGFPETPRCPVRGCEAALEMDEEYDPTAAREDLPWCCDKHGPFHWDAKKRKFIDV
jgi:hypothetical protein